MKLHIVMPVINCIELTKQAVESIKSPGIIHFIDNGSTDETIEWATNKAKEDHSFLYRRNMVPKGVSASWNQGIRESFEDPECEYVAVLNNDIILHPKTLDHLMAYMDESKYLMVTGDNVKDRMSFDTLLQMELPVSYTDFDLNPISDWRAEGPDFSCYMINRDTIKYIGWFDEKFIGAYCEDWDYHVRIDRARRFKAQYGHPEEVELNRIHAKRLTTAPYFHFASQTIGRNESIRGSISKNHGQNKLYYSHKWGLEDHGAVMDGQGNMTPFGDAQKNYKDW